MADYVEFQDLKARMDTGDAAVGTYPSATRKFKTINPDGIRQDYSGAEVLVEGTWLAVQIPPALFKGGRWRFSIEAVDLGNKVRKRKWVSLDVLAEGEV